MHNTNEELVIEFKNKLAAEKSLKKKVILKKIVELIKELE